MNAVAKLLHTDLPALLSPLGGGFFAGVLLVNGAPHALVIAPKAEGERSAAAWGEFGRDVEGACSVNDGLANTDAMAAAGSALAQWARALRIGGHDDWHIPARDALELMYRHCKPTAQKNFASFRDGENPSSQPVGFAYTEESPTQCANPLFQEGGAEAFAPAWHWSSTQYSARYAWFQGFGGGSQTIDRKDGEGRARAVRTIPLSH